MAAGHRSCHGGAACGQQAKQVISNRLTKLDEQADVFGTK